MPNHSNFPSAPVASGRSKPSPSDSARRLALLDATVLRWLLDAGWPKAEAATRMQALAPAIGQWLIDTRPELMFDRLLSLADRLAEQMPNDRAPIAAAFTTAFARSVISQAIDEVALEAQRAGHANVFAGLRPYLHIDPATTALAELGVGLQMSPPALVIALSRLRRRLRQRVEAGLGLWATNPESRHTLRQQLRQSLIGRESTP